MLPNQCFDRQVVGSRLGRALEQKCIAGRLQGKLSFLHGAIRVVVHQHSTGTAAPGQYNRLFAHLLKHLIDFVAQFTRRYNPR
jgi:hypothetical protein